MRSTKWGHQVTSAPIRARVLCLTGLFLSAAIAAQAAPIVYGDFPGVTIDYIGVQEESSTDPGAALFGAPTVGGDAIDFDPQAFAASSSGLESDTVDGNLQFMVQAKAGFGINSISFSEAGDTTLAGLLGEAETTVGAAFFIDILEVNIGGILTPIALSVPPTAMTFAPQDSFLLSVDGPGTSTWTGSLFVDMGPTLAANSITGTVTKISVSLNNSLTASSVEGTSAFIQKKDVDALVVSIDTFEIPEPTSAAIALLAACGLGCMTRRVGS